jgi:hypothetical protein
MCIRHVLMSRVRFVSFLVLVCLSPACGGAACAPGKPEVWIDVPADGSNVLVGQPVQIEGHVSCDKGIASVEIWVDGELQLVHENPPAVGKLAQFGQAWTPLAAGDYDVQVIAVGDDGVRSEPAVVRVLVAEKAAEANSTATLSPPSAATLSPTSAATLSPTSMATLAPTSTATPESSTTTSMPTATVEPTPEATAVSPTESPTPVSPLVTDIPTLTRPAAPTVDFWADAEQVEAGSCTALRWRVENAQAVFLDGDGVSLEGALEICPCDDAVYTLSVTGLDNEQEERQLTVRVVGSCDTPTARPTVPFSDSNPPPAPQPISPADGDPLACESQVTLEWEAVTDPSGIEEYQIEVQRAPIGVNWESVDESPWTSVSATELEIPIECGWHYRWRVRAVDGAGNVGPFPDWFVFILPLA